MHNLPGVWKAELLSPVSSLRSCLILVPVLYSHGFICSVFVFSSPFTHSIFCSSQKESYCFLGERSEASEGRKIPAEWDLLHGAWAPYPVGFESESWSNLSLRQRGGNDELPWSLSVIAKSLVSSGICTREDSLLSSAQGWRTEVETDPGRTFAGAQVRSWCGVEAEVLKQRGERLW